MKLSRASWGLAATWLAVTGGYALVSLLAPRGDALTTFGDIVQCLAPLFASTCLLLNAGSADWRKNAFWMMLAFGCTLWMVGQLFWTYSEAVLHQPTNTPYFGDVIMFLHVVPMIAALALQPHVHTDEPNFRLGYLDFTLLLMWWVYLYLFSVTPWQYVAPDLLSYGQHYNELYAVENAVLVMGLLLFALRVRGYWRGVYVHLFGAALLFTLSAEWIDLGLDSGKYYTGSIYDVPLVMSFIWFGTAGIRAFRESRAAAVPAKTAHSERVWPLRLAMCAVLSMPLLAAWSAVLSQAPPAVRQFRLFVTLEAILIGTALVFWRQRMVDRERLRLLYQLQESFREMKRLQSQFAQAEKFASLGQLAAGVAHEINNPLTAILGYSDLLVDETAANERTRKLAAKIRDQARRTKDVVADLIATARRVSPEKTAVDINGLLHRIVQLRMACPDERRIRIALETERGLPGVLADSDRLLHVFYTLINRVADVIEQAAGSVLNVRSLTEKGNVVVEIGDVAAGAAHVSDRMLPYYSTDLSDAANDAALSLCHGVVRDYGGQIFCGTASEKATFRIELPGIPHPSLKMLAASQARHE